MTASSFIGVLGMLGLVLGLLLVTLRLVRRYLPLDGRADGRVPLQVLQRVALGPRQSIAVVRIGDQHVAVSVGEGGVRLITHVAGADEADKADRSPSVAGDGDEPPSQRSALFQRLLSAATRAPVVIGVLFAAAAACAHHAWAQGAPSGAPATTAQAPAKAAAKNLARMAAQAAAQSPAPAKPAPVNAGQTTAPKKAAPAAAAQSPAPAASPPIARADTMVSRLAPRLDLRVGNEQAGGLRLSGTVGIVVMMGLLTLLPMLVLMMTGFTRILIVLNFLRQAIGAQSAPPTQLVAGLALLLTGFVMAPTLAEVNRTALTPWMDGRIDQTQMLADGVKPFREFMLRQTRERDLTTFMNMSRLAPVARADDVPLVVLVSAFVTSELRVAFQMGFALFLPFIVIDIVVASVLMSMGMMMLPPAMISLPFKLLLFVLVDGWTLVTQSLVQSFR